MCVQTMPRQSGHVAEKFQFNEIWNFTKSGILETFSSLIDEDVMVIVLRTSLSSVLGFWTWYACEAPSQI